MHRNRTARDTSAASMSKRAELNNLANAVSVTRGATKSKRTGRMAELIQSVIARLLIKDVRDPRMSSATVTGVDLAPDFGCVTVFFTILDATPKAIKTAEKTFEKASGYFRVQLSQLTELRYTPKITFKYDASVMQAEHISRLLDAV